MQAEEARRLAYYHWRKKYAGWMPSEMKRLRLLEAEEDLARSSPEELAEKTMTEHDHFANADRQVSELKERLSRQREVVERARQRGHPTGAAESILRTIESSLRAFERHRERIFGRLERSGDVSR